MHHSRQQLAFVVRTLIVDGLPESFSQQVDATPGTDLRLADLLQAGWTVAATEAMPGGFESTCLIVVEAPRTETACSHLNQAVALDPEPMDRRDPARFEWHAPGLAAWDGETIPIDRLGSPRAS